MGGQQPLQLVEQLTRLEVLVRGVQAAELIDGLVSQCGDMCQGWGVIRYRERFGFNLEVFSDEKQQLAEKTYLTETLPRHLDYFEKILAANGGATYDTANFLRQASRARMIHRLSQPEAADVEVPSNCTARAFRAAADGKLRLSITCDLE